MQGSLMFVHGTGVREGLKNTLTQVRAGAAKWLDLAEDQVVGPEWGSQVGPKDLDMTSVLPPERTVRAISSDDAPTDTAVDTPSWALLIEDPLLELRALAASQDVTVAAPIVAGQPPETVFQGLLEQLTIPDAQLHVWGVTGQELKVATSSVRSSEALATAAQRSASAQRRVLLDAVARAVTATLLHGYRDDPKRDLPVVALSGEARGQLVAAVREALAGEREESTRAWNISKAFWQVTGPLALRLGTTMGQQHRGKLMDPASDFVRDVAFYIRRGEQVREYLTKELSHLPQEGPIVVIGHSLGGIAMVDVLSASNAPRVDLLVTVGSQAPFLYLLDAMQTLRPTASQADPFVPWLNLYSRADFLSFCASRLFEGVTGITDEEIDAGVPFPESHSAYWVQEKTYTTIRKYWP